jgi:small-conductance mechanosensitive channel
MTELLGREALGNSVARWMLAAGIAVLAAVLLRVVALVAIKNADRIARRTAIAWDDTLIAALEKTRWFFYLVLGLYFGSLSVTLPPVPRLWAVRAFELVSLLQIGLWLHAAIKQTVTRWKADAAGTPERATAASAIGFIARLTVWTSLALMALTIVGIKITALVAGLGVGGVAAALAVQNLLGDLIASLSIYFDRPFDIGEFIVTADGNGTVERISMRSTRLRALGGEELIYANGELVKKTIQNFGRMKERRVVLEVGVEYSTPADKLRALPKLLESVVTSTPDVRFDRAHFAKFGASALLFEVVYYVLSPDYTTYMDRQQTINFGVVDRLAELGVSMAFPTRTVFVKNEARTPVSALAPR